MPPAPRSLPFPSLALTLSHSRTPSPFLFLSVGTEGKRGRGGGRGQGRRGKAGRFVLPPSPTPSHSFFVRRARERDAGRQGGTWRVGAVARQGRAGHLAPFPPSPKFSLLSLSPKSEGGRRACRQARESNARPRVPSLACPSPVSGRHMPFPSRFPSSLSLSGKKREEIVLDGCWVDAATFLEQAWVPGSRHFLDGCWVWRSRHFLDGCWAWGGREI